MVDLPTAGSPARTMSLATSRSRSNQLWTVIEPPKPRHNGPVLRRYRRLQGPEAPPICEGSPDVAHHRGRRVRMTLDELTDRMKTAVGSDSGLGKTLKFNLKGEGCVLIDGGSVTNDDKPADLTL